MTTTAPVDLRIDPVAGALGAEIRGVHLGSLDDAEFAAAKAKLLG